MTSYAPSYVASYTAKELRKMADALDTLTDAQCTGSRAEHLLLRATGLAADLRFTVRDLTGRSPADER